MALVKAKCTSCGADLEVDSLTEAAVCPYCGMAYIVEKAINNFNTINSISAEVVNIATRNDFVIRAGMLTEYNGAAPDVVIPDNVRIIGESVFEDCAALTGVVIPEGVTEIGDSAFAGCSSLTRLTFPRSLLRIGDEAFAGCEALTKVTVPESVREIGDSPFYACPNLSDISIPRGRAEFYESLFCGTGIRSVTVPAFVETVGEYAFFECDALESVVIEYGVREIGEGAFSGCTALRSITIPDSVTEIGEDAFEDCEALTEVNASEAWKRDHWDAIDILSDYAPEEKTGGCYIATAVYGSYDCPQVRTLRRFRDERLAATAPGRAFIRCYYALSPVAVRLFGRSRLFRAFWKKHLDRAVDRLRAKGTADTPYRDRPWR